MISLDARSLIYELRSIRMALRDHNTHFEVTLASAAAEEQLAQLIEVIENVATLLQPSALSSATQAGMGENEWWLRLDGRGRPGVRSPE